MAVASPFKERATRTGIPPSRAYDHMCSLFATKRGPCVKHLRGTLMGVQEVVNAVRGLSFT
ncbi:hypothetical protein J6590_050647 [Homalodisca vitripennis]|nr:hypothetical protein J6590_050647 [Homalodisca vitripennis]